MSWQSVVSETLSEKPCSYQGGPSGVIQPIRVQQGDQVKRVGSQHGSYHPLPRFICAHFLYILWVCCVQSTGNGGRLAHAVLTVIEKRTVETHKLNVLSMPTPWVNSQSWYWENKFSATKPSDRGHSCTFIFTSPLISVRNCFNWGSEILAEGNHWPHMDR